MSPDMLRFGFRPVNARKENKVKAEISRLLFCPTTNPDLEVYLLK